jgi:hypothetical protein
MDTLFDLEDVPYRYIVGIDLGTTNSALAYVERTKPGEERQRIRFFDVPQLVSLGEIGRRSILPSFLYLPGPYELPPESTALPWDARRDHAVGEFAREQGALVPGRLVSSAKSWLCHGGVDRTAAILPWGAGQDVGKVSPVEASGRYLRHLKESWNQVMARGREGYRLEEQLVVLTVPASFDEVARELTVTAAREAGISRVVLVEEPLAAFYAWLSMHEADWRQGMSPGQLILVCDVGGGTTDFTLVAVRHGEKDLRFDRLAVGDHLMLGGDNMDLLLAREIERQLLGQQGQLESKRWHQLWHQCRKAKEVLLGAESSPVSSPAPTATATEARNPDFVDITLVGSGGKLIGGTLKGRLSRPQVEELILEGFFPFVSLDDVPKGGRRTGLTEWGLPYVQDPAVTRHLAFFWQRCRPLVQQETGRSSLYPDFILFNGGALTPAPIQSRILSVVAKWFQEVAGQDWSPIELDNPAPELAVAIGAAYYGMVRLGEGVRVGAGSPRAYYVEVAASTEEKAEENVTSAVCLVPRGTEEGFEAQFREPSFQVLTNQPVSFQLFSSNTRLGDRLAQVVTLSADEITPLPPIKTVLRYGRKAAAQPLPVQLAVRLTEVGTLELWCQSQQSSHRWQLQFDVRQSGEVVVPSQAAAGETVDASLIQQAREKILATFQGCSSAAGHPPEQLVKNLVSTLDLGKEKWPTTLIRKLADSLLEVERGRSLSPQHEARWLNVMGFCMRPGFGDPLDEWRMREIWKVYPRSLDFSRQAQSRSEWWIFWRRVAGGLAAGHQWHIYLQVLPIIQPGDKKKKKTTNTKKISRSLSKQEELEIWMFLANLERLPANTKTELGTQLLQKILKGRPKPQELWALSRLGARMPFYGPLDQVVPAKEAAVWLNGLFSMRDESSEGMARAMVQLARRTGDRERDLSQTERDNLAGWLMQQPQGNRLIELLTHPEADLMGQEKDWIFGEALPAGLSLSSEPDLAEQV